MCSSVIGHIIGHINQNRRPAACLRDLVWRLILFLLICIISTTVFAESNAPLELSLRDAILLAVRENPNVQQSQLNHVMQKFALHVQQWQFQPHYSFNASRTVVSNTTSDIRETTKSTVIQPAATLLTPIGTQLTLSSVNTFSNHYNPGLSLQVMQPLMQGFGRPIVEAALYNAMDTERISRLNVEGTLRITITAVINAYLDVVATEHTVENDKKAIERAELSVKQTQLFINAGHKAGNEIVTVQADVANAQTTLQNDENNLLQARYALLAAIGLDPNTDVKFTNLDVLALIHQYSVPTLKQTLALTLLNDIQYQVDEITYEGSTKRALMLAEDNKRWQLNLTLNGGVGQSSGGGENAGLNSLVNGANKTGTAQLSLQIPIDNQSLEQGVVNAKIGLRQAQIALKQEKWNKETGAINGWNTIASAERALHFAENASRLQSQTYDVSYKKYLYGLIDSTALQSVQQQLINTDQSLVNARINYLKSLANLDLLTGTTLQTWNVQVRYS
jgi:outer membrane protein TolC